MGSCNEFIANMKKQDEEKLLEGVQKHNYELFWEINQPLSDKHLADLKKYAVRIYSNKYANFVQPNFEVEPPTNDGDDDQRKFQEWEQKNYDVTIGDLLEKAFPNLFKQLVDENDPTNNLQGIQ